ncbi:MAG: thioesterase family protein [Porticoccus sp.]|uniref:acyl-CoA thioesterase n=1 Tax=Porticoccus sp. TaxID=2024853 RepID=UPI0032999D7D
MFELRIQPRFSETDALGHINNTVVPVWFEAARADIFRLVHPSLNPADWPMILAHIAVDFVHQIHLGSEVAITTGIKKIGNKSFTVAHLAHQKGVLVAKGEAVLVWFDYAAQCSRPLPNAVRKLITPLLLEHNDAP